MDDDAPLSPYEESELLAWAEAAILAAKTPRLSVSFLPNGPTIGPVLAVKIDGPRMIASSGCDEADLCGHYFMLAVYDPEAGGWRVNDGMGDGPAFRGWRVDRVGE